MNRIKNLDRYQQGILLLLAAMLIVFCGIYAVTTSRVGILYEDHILVPGEQDGNRIYTATVKGLEWRFTVTPDKTVTFQWGNRMYGPYTAKEDPSAIPEEHTMIDAMTGVEVKEGERIIFRGGLVAMGGNDPFWMLVDEDGSNMDVWITAVMSDGTEMDSNGNIIDPMEPSVSTILKLMHGPELTHKGQWIAWFCCLLLSALNAASILFADEMFRWNLTFQIRNADRVEPSEWELGRRYIGWTAMTIMTFALYIMGLQ